MVLGWVKRRYKSSTKKRDRYLVRTIVNEHNCLHGLSAQEHITGCRLLRKLMCGWEEGWLSGGT